ncbi:MAG: type II toxin-antitoxin system Phd/YefM family antitoxin [bacterium]|nr:type II toxin-antitoxin system Phd/YefM family antitoxin [bacterium]
MTRLTTTAARKDFASVVNRTAYGKERVVLGRRGKDLAALVPIEDLTLLEQLEDALDLSEARKALADPKNRKRIPWKKVKADLGL